MLKNSKAPSVPNRQVQRTCSWILEAILLLADEMPYSKITVSDIVKKAGIARQTFYRNFRDKDEVILQYFSNVFVNTVLNVENVNNKDNKNNIVLTFNIKYMINQQTNLKKMLTSGGILNLFTDNINKWLDSLSRQGVSKLNKEEKLIYRYKIIYQVTGVLDVIMDWFRNDMPATVDNLLNQLNHLTVDTRPQYPNVPNITIKIIES